MYLTARHEAAGQRYRQTTQFWDLGGLIDASADTMPEIKRRVRLAWACCSRFKRELYNMEADPFALKLRMLEAEVMETLLYGCVTWTLGKEHFAELRMAHHNFPTDHWLPAPATHRPPHVVHQGTMRERRDDHPQAASHVCGGRTADAQ